MFKAAQFPNEVWIAHTHCHDRQHEIIIAPSRKSLIATYTEMLWLRRDIRIEKAWNGKIIDLPPEDCKTYNESMYVWNLSEFRHSITALVAGYYHKTGDFLPGIKKCICFETREFNFLTHIGPGPHGCSICFDCSFTLEDSDWDGWFKKKHPDDCQPAAAGTDVDSYMLIKKSGRFTSRGIEILPSSVLAEMCPEEIAGAFTGTEIDLSFDCAAVKLVVRDESDVYAEERSRKFKRHQQEIFIRDIQKEFDYSGAQISEIRSKIESSENKDK